MNRNLKQLLKGALLGAWGIYFVTFCFITVMWLDHSTGYERDGGSCEIGSHVILSRGGIIMQNITPGVPGRRINQRLSEASEGLPIWDYTFQQAGPLKSYNIGQGYVFWRGRAMPFQNLFIPFYVPWLLTLPSLFTGLARIAIAKKWAQLINLKRKFRSRKGLCINCGYDMRATPNQCPECGTAADAH